MTFLRDVRYGLRLLARNPTFGAAAVSAVALGIGATTAVFSVDSSFTSARTTPRRSQA